MNYYNSNCYQNYPYGNTQFYQQQPQYQMPTQQQSQMNTVQPQGLNGKLVDTVDMVKVTEVPVGGYGIFPKADLNEIYLKYWNPNGTTSITTFKPIESPCEIEPKSEIAEVLERINILENKIDAVLSPKAPSTSETAQKDVYGIKRNAR